MTGKPDARDPRAVTGFASAEAYEAGRPGYPLGAVDEIVGAYGLGGESTVLDLAAGTGKLTRLIAPFVGRTIAVEPSEGMRAKLREHLPDVEAVTGTAEDIRLPDSSVDAVVVGEAFHWFDVPHAAAEIARVLRPGGGLALMWNRAQDAPFAQLLEPYRTAAGDYPSGSGKWRLELDRTELFEPLRTASFDHAHELTPDQFVALVSSWSWIANLPADERADVLVRVAALAHARGDLVLHYRTELHLARTARP